MLVEALVAILAVMFVVKLKVVKMENFDYKLEVKFVPSTE